mmetsp:Transcript_97683/g.232536  ORF Transcript_97683/g.232536 Transcript_97683/m.232536 type:complete len:221 (-) Transcript_97683:238-900(-)
MRDACFSEDLAVPRLGAPEGTLRVRAEQRDPQLLGKLHLCICGVEARHRRRLGVDGILDALQRPPPRQQLLRHTARRMIIATDGGQSASGLLQVHVAGQVAQVVLDQRLRNILRCAHHYMHLAGAKEEEVPQQSQLIVADPWDLHQFLPIQRERGHHHQIPLRIVSLLPQKHVDGMVGVTDGSLQLTAGGTWLMRVHACVLINRVSHLRRLLAGRGSLLR